MGGDGLSATALLRPKKEECDMEHNDTSARRRQRKRLRLMIDISALVLAILLVVLLIVQATGKDELAGIWSDDYTIIEFNGKGKGVWYRGDEVERFTYKINSDEVALDFKRENVQDVTYRFVLDNQHLALADDDGNQMSMHPIQ